MKHRARPLHQRYPSQVDRRRSLLPPRDQEDSSGPEPTQVSSYRRYGACPMDGTISPPVRRPRWPGRAGLASEAAASLVEIHNTSDVSL